MKRFVCAVTVFILISTSFFTCDFAKGNENNALNSIIKQYDKGFRYNIQGWIYLHIEGEPYERGYQHGYLLYAEIVDMITRWSNMIHNQPKIKKLTKSISEERYDKISETWWNFCKNEAYKLYKDKYAEYSEYKNEIQGIADGVKDRGGKIFGRDVTYQDILACNEMYEVMSKLTTKKLRFIIHPLLTLFKNLKEVEPSIGKIGALGFINDFYGASNHKCNGFIATGDATTNNQLIMANSMWSTDTGSMWWWSYYITYRWSLILDINPSKGNRVIMSSAPGYIWSDHDYYQNDKGIVLLETTDPQGLFDNKGLPVAIRARRAVQYGNSVDDVMSILKYRNDGCMDAVWLIGDAKTGDIVRFELGYRNSWYNKTQNGFYWSANNPMNLRVRFDKFDFVELLKEYIYKIVLKSNSYVFYTLRYVPSVRDLTYEDLGNKGYGSIDINYVKGIMSNDSISRWSPDSKMTSSHLIENNGLWVNLGNPAGLPRKIYNLSDKTLKIQEIPPLGWVRFYGLPDKQDFSLLSKDLELGNQTDIKWTYETNDVINNTFSSSSIVINDTLFSTTSDGELNALHLDGGTFIWNMSVGEKPTAPAFYNNKIFIGTSQGLKIVDIETKKQSEKLLGKILSRPVIADGKVFVGNENGDVYALNAKTGESIWNISLQDEVYISEPENNHLFIGSGKNCYSIDINSGEILWSFETGGVITSRPYFFDGTVYFGSWDTFIYALRANDGTLNWKYETGWGIETTPIVSERMVFVGGLDNNFYALDIDSGDLKWFFTCKAAIHSNPATYGQYVFFGCDDGRFYALNKTNGDAAWSFAPGLTIDNEMYNYITTPILSEPTVDKGVVYVGAKGNIYALDAQTIEQSIYVKAGSKTQSDILFFVVIFTLIIIIFITSIIIIGKKQVKKKVL